MYWIKKILKGLWAAICTALGIYGVVVGCIVATGTIEIHIRTIFLLILGFIVIVIIFVTMLINMKREINKMVTLPIHGFDTERKNVLYIEETGDIRNGTLVTLYVRNRLDDRIGYGVVFNVSTKYIAIEVLEVLEGYDKLIEMAKCNDKEVLKKLYVMPRIYWPEVKRLQQIRGGE